MKKIIKFIISIILLLIIGALLVYINKPKVIFLGDSIIYRAEWSICMSLIVMNYGHDGDTTSDILKRLDAVIKEEPKVVFLLVGINDVVKNKNIQDIFANYIKIVSQLREHNIDVVVQEVILTSYPGINLKVIELNRLIKSYCTTHAIKYIALNKVLSQKENLKIKYTIDGIHLNKEAYIEWENYILFEYKKFID